MTTATELADKCEDFLASVLGLAFHLTEHMTYDKHNPRHLVSVCLYLRLVELAAGCKSLLEKNTIVGIPILHRSIFEADIDLTNSMHSDDYSKQMYATFLEEKLRVAKEAATDRQNPYVELVRAHRDSSADVNAIKAELDGYKKAGHGPMKIRCRADLAGRLNEYLSVYNMLCLDTHNNIRSLELWHLDKTTNTDYQVALFRMTKKDVAEHLISIPLVVLNQSHALASMLGVDSVEFDRYFSDAESLQRLAKETLAMPQVNTQV